MQIINYEGGQYVSTTDAKQFLGLKIHQLYNQIKYHRSIDTIKIGQARMVELKSLRKLKKSGNYPGGKTA